MILGERKRSVSSFFLVETRSTTRFRFQIHANTRQSNQLRTAIPLRLTGTDAGKGWLFATLTATHTPPLEGWKRLKLGYINE